MLRGGNACLVLHQRHVGGQAEQAVLKPTWTWKSVLTMAQPPRRLLVHDGTMMALPLAHCRRLKDREGVSVFSHSKESPTLCGKTRASWRRIR